MSFIAKLAFVIVAGSSNQAAPLPMPAAQAPPVLNINADAPKAHIESFGRIASANEIQGYDFNTGAASRFGRLC